MNKEVENKIKKFNKVKRILMLITICLLTISSNVYAADDPLQVINNLSDFMFSILRVVGWMLIGWAAAQFGLSLKSHDPSQRATSIWGVVGGIIIAYSKEILNIIIG